MSTPGVFIRSTISRLSPLLPFCSGSVRHSRIIQSACTAWPVQILLPLTTYSSPSRMAVVFRWVRSEPPSGSE